MDANRCVCCDDIIPEGSLLCSKCLANDIIEKERNPDTRREEFEELKQKMKNSIKAGRHFFGKMSKQRKMS